MNRKIPLLSLALLAVVGSALAQDYQFTKLYYGLSAELPLTSAPDTNPGDGGTPPPDGSGEPDANAGFVTRLSTSTATACTISSGGMLYCWGSGSSQKPDGDPNYSPQAQPVAISGGWKQVVLAANHYTGCGLKTDGTLWCWGYNAGFIPAPAPLWDETIYPAQFGVESWTSVTSNTSGSAGCAIRASDKALHCWDSEDRAPLPLAGGPGNGWSQISMGERHSCGITVSNYLLCWGWNDYGQTGLGSTPLVTSPTFVGADWKQVSANGARSCGVKQDGSLWCWGWMWSFTQYNTPTELAPGTAWKSVSTGTMMSCGVKTDGTLWCWGTVNRFNNTGYDTVTAPRQVGVASDWEAVSSAGDDLGCGFKTDGSTWCWGYTAWGEVDYGGLPVQMTYP